MWNVLDWAVASHEQAILNARQASTECGRRAVERAEVNAYLAALAETTATPEVTAIEQLAAVR